MYNGSAIYLCSSLREGFGLTSIEAMSGGAALVTTDNGGSDDYAVPGRTALVSPSSDVDALVANMRSLLQDDPRRIEIATAGCEYVKQFTWDHSAGELESFLERYVADPAEFGSPPR